MKQIELPTLPYAYDALEPYIDAKTMELHHTKHHQTYVDKLKAALENSGKTYPSNMETLLENIDNYPNAVRNHGGGHYNHTLFWESLTPKRKNEPQGELAYAIRQSFGNLDTCIKAFSKQAAALFGSGWTWLSLNAHGEIQIVSTPNQDNPLMNKQRDGIPLLGLDLWEHAYYLHYQNRRPEYIAAFWNIVDWKVIQRRYGQALQA